MVYQIFPDRYRRDAAWRERCEHVLEQPKAGIPRRIVEDWDELPAMSAQKTAPSQAGISMAAP